MRNYFKHESAFVDEGATVGKGTKIWHFSHISSTAIIGSNVVIGQNVFVAGNVSIGNNCRIQNNVSIFEGVELDENVFCGPSMVFTNVKNPRAEINKKNQFQKTLIGKGVTLGANCTIVCGVKIGKYAFIGAGALITKNVNDFALFVGNPGRQTGWVGKYGEKLNVPLDGHKETKCINTGEKYILSGNQLKLYDD